ncbi:MULTISPECIES: hypothetical protein [unclassified Mucilaginibacter]|uniref:hypothetical protein n=1 Tax=unclassified Mucilaginibacter TaxID=2617802 RepID=UPI003398476A
MNSIAVLTFIETNFGNTACKIAMWNIQPVNTKEPMVILIKPVKVIDLNFPGKGAGL